MSIQLNYACKNTITSIWALVQVQTVAESGRVIHICYLVSYVTVRFLLLSRLKSWIY